MFVSTEENRDLMRIERMHKIEITEINLAGEVVPRPPKSENKNGGKKRRYDYRGKSHGRSGDKNFRRDKNGKPFRNNRKVDQKK